MVYYRKYRPKKIEELDSKEVRNLLYSVLSPKDIAHAFLFTGPKGLGKTSTARIVAKVVNCEEKSKVKSQKSKLQLKTQKLRNEGTQDQIEPCNKCYQCISITNGSNIDVLEIDAASNRGIDEIRDLREKVRLAPAASKKKVYIIDEVHMLTTEAFNALLKTLEEPPSHVIFILCTTEPHKVPATIVSRCFHITFKKATIEELVRSFKRIAEKEKLKIDDEMLKFIATLSDGSFRDGVKILEEIALKADGKKITKSLVEERYQMSNISMNVEKMIHFLGKRDTKQALLLVSELLEYGVDMKHFIEKLIEDLHGNFLITIGVNKDEKMPLVNLTLDEIKPLIELLARAHVEMKYAVLSQLPLELAIIEWSEIKKVALRSPARGPATPFPPTGAPASLADAANAVRASGSPSSRVTPRSENDTNNFWQELIDKVKVYNHSVAGVLRGCGLKSYDNKKIVIETGYKFHKERLEEKKTQEIIERVYKELVGKPVVVSVVLKHENSRL